MKYIVKTTYHKDDITSAIEKSEYGDEIVITKGTYHSYPWTLKSGLTITLEEGANVYFSTDKRDYLKPTFIRFEGVECESFHPLIYSYNQNDITIRGKGCLFGNGYAWWKYKKMQQESCNRLCYAEAKHIPVSKRVIDIEHSCLRPDFINLIEGKNITLVDFTIQDSPMWMIHPVYIKNFTAKNITLISDGPNTDGIDPDSCEDVLIEGCTFQTGDDGIAIDSGLNEDGLRVNRPCKNIEVRNCQFYKGHASVAIGSCMSGGVENVSIHDLQIHHSERGIRIKSLPGRGGYVRNIDVHDIQMDEIEKEAIDITMHYPSSTSIPYSALSPKFEEMTFKDIEIKKAKIGVSAIGLSDSHIQNLKFQNIKFGNVEERLIKEYVDEDLSYLEEESISSNID
jgi:polygalacturonase